MPLSKKRDAARKKEEYRLAKEAKLKSLRGQGTALLSKALLRKLSRSGIDPARYLTTVPVSLDDYRDLERRLEAKTQRVE